MTAPETKPRSTLATLREQVPQRPLTGNEVRQVLDRQATRLLRLSDTFGPPVPVEAIATALPCEFPNYLVLSHFPERRDKPAWRRRWKSSTSKG